MNWSALIVGQLEYYWDVHLRPRLEGLTDEEYFWKPVPGAWTIRPAQDGRWLIDDASPEPVPTPVPTIAWRMMHLAAEGLYNRASAFFGNDPFGDISMNDPRRVPTALPANATDAIAFVEDAYNTWHAGISALTEEQMSHPLGPKGGPFANDSMAALVVHINREIMHHGGEIGLLRDIYAHNQLLAVNH